MEIQLELQKSTRNYHKYQAPAGNRFICTLYIPVNELTSPPTTIKVSIVAERTKI